MSRPGSFPVGKVKKFWESVIRFDETSPKPLDVLRDEDLVMPPADELDDEGIHQKLWDIIFAMSMHRWYLQQTDHLSDRELYRELVEYLLLEVTPSTSPDTNMHIDILGGCSEHDLWLCARYYWAESFREDWLERFPDAELPERIDPRTMRWDRFRSGRREAPLDTHRVEPPERGAGV